MRTYTYDSAIYARKITLIGIFCTAVLIYAGVRIQAGGSLPVWTGVGVVAAYTVWETFISLSNPRQVRMDEHEIIFSAYGREHRYGWNEISQFRVKELTGARKLFIRINQAGFFRGRYWLHCYYFNDTDELYNAIVDRECLIHPDSIKAWARGKSKPVS